MQKENIISSVQNEFWFHVARQEEIQLAGIIGKDIDVDKLECFLNAYKRDFKSSFDEFLIRFLLEFPDIIDLLRALVGISDKRAYLDLSYIFAKTKDKEDININILGESFYKFDKHSLSYFKNMLKKKEKKLDLYASIISSYFTKNDLEQVVSCLSKLKRDEYAILIDKWVNTKEGQQSGAKRRGHGAEIQLAILLDELSISYIPADKTINPMSHDPNVDRKSFEIAKKNKDTTWSFDLIIEHESIPVVFIQSLIHTSDPGQYGVNKSNETLIIKNDIRQYNIDNKCVKYLWGIVDGVGFSENKKDTIDKMLEAFDCFIQIKTMYKAALKLNELGILRNPIKGIKYDDKVYSDDEMRLMHMKYGVAHKKYGTDVVMIKNDSDLTRIKYNKCIKAGVATLYI